MSKKLLISVVLISSLVACGGAEERKAVYMEKAKASIEAGNIDKARIELKNVLQIDPKDAEAYYQLGLVFEQTKDLRKAYANYLKAEELNPDLLGSKARLGRIYLIYFNDVSKAQEEVDYILAKDSTHIEGQLLKAAILLAEGKKSEAIAIAESVLSRAPGEASAAIFLSSLHLRYKNTNEAINILNSALEINRNNLDMSLFLGAALVNEKKYEQAADIYKGVLESSPENVTSYNRLASVYELMGNDEDAESVLRASIKNNPEHVERYLTLIQYIRSIKGEDEAIKQLKQFANKKIGLGKLRLSLGELLLLNNNKESAIDVFQSVINDFSEEEDGIRARTILAIFHAGNKDFIKASELVEETIIISPNDPKINFVRAKLALRNKDTEKALISLRIVTKETPQNIDAYFLLVKAYQLENNSEQVESTLNSAYANNKTNAEALLKLAQYYYKKDVIKSEKIIDDYNAVKVNDYDGLSFKATVLNQNKEYKEAYTIAETLMELFTDKPNGYVQSIPYLRQTKNKSLAISYLEKGYLIVDDNKIILKLLSAYQLVEKQYDIVEKRLKVEIEASPKSVDLKLLLVKAYIVQKNYEMASLLLKEIIENNPEQEQPYLLLAASYKAKSDMRSVITVLEKGAKNVVNSMKISFNLAALYESNKDYEKAINVYRGLLNNYPENLIIANNLVSLLSDYGDNKGQDLELTNKLREKLKTSEQPTFMDTIGWSYYKQGDYKNAVEYLTRSAEKLPKNNTANYHLGMAFKMAGDSAQARIFLEKSLFDKKSFNEMDAANIALKSL